MAISARSRGRDALDDRLADLRPVDRFARPPRGWLRAVRDALGMSSTQLAQRLGVDRSTVLRMEQSEQNDAIALRTLRRAADALDCTLVYALVPKRSLEETVSARARQIAAQHLAGLEHTMALEAQGLPDERRVARIAEHADRLVDDRNLWE